MSTRTASLNLPRGTRRRGVHYDPDAFGRFSESIASFLGTARFLVAQTVLVAAWITFNVFTLRAARFDPYPFILLNLAFSTQAAYSAPLILLAQKRQVDRDRVQSERDRRVNDRTLADTDFLARELASVRIGLAALEGRVTTTAAQSASAEGVDRLLAEMEALRAELQ